MACIPIYKILIRVYDAKCPDEVLMYSQPWKPSLNQVHLRHVYYHEIPTVIQPLYCNSILLIPN